MNANSSDILLSARSINKSFAGLRALQDISFDIPKNCIYGIIGPNGAGKTTLFNIITGMYQADTGELWFNSENIIKLPPHKIVCRGIARTFQNIKLFSNMSALENVMVGRHTQSSTQLIGSILRPKRTRDEEESILDHSCKLLKYVGLSGFENKIAKDLSYGDQRRLEIARALASNPKLIALDEPAAGMNPSETKKLQTLLEQILADNISIVLIEHDVKFVMNLCKRVLVLDYGVRIAEDFPAEIQKNPKVIEAYIGIPI